MKYKIVRTVHFETHENQREQKQAEKARIMMLHLVRELNKRKEITNHESKKQ